MKRNGLFSLLLGTVIAGSFAAGVFEPELRAQGGLPETIFSVRPTGNGRELEPANTYSKVLREVRERYYGNLDSDMKLTYGAIRGMLNTLDDPYTRFLDPIDYADLRSENDGSFEGIGAHLDPRPTPQGYIRIVKPLPHGPADKAGIKKGDMIARVDGRSVVGMSVDDAVRIIRGKANSMVHLTVVRPGSPRSMDFSIVRQPVEFEVVDYRMLDGNIGYVSLAQFNEMADQKIEHAVRDLDRKGMRGLVLDLRGNPGGLLDAAIAIGSELIPSNHTVVIIQEAGGERDARKTEARRYLGGKWPVVVLIDRTSASASEILAGALKDNSAAKLVGTTTFGKGLVQTVVPLEDGSACMITTAKWLRPSGRDINRSREQRGGVEPDYPLEVSEAEWLANKDPQLEKAKELIRGGGATTAAR